MEQLQKFAATLPSYHDVKGVKPETFYHGMMIGLLASLEPDYEVRSNRESGNGRPDVLIKPRYPGKPGVILELKVARAVVKTIERAMTEGHLQLAANDYASELRAAGVEKIQQMAVAFDGKRVMVLPQGAKPPKKSRVVQAVGESIRKTAKKVASSAKKALKENEAMNETVRTARATLLCYATRTKPPRTGRLTSPNRFQPPRTGRSTAPNRFQPPLHGRFMRLFELHITIFASIDLESTRSKRLDRSIDLLEAVETSWATFDDLGKVVLT